MLGLLEKSRTFAFGLAKGGEYEGGEIKKPNTPPSSGSTILRMFSDDELIERLNREFADAKVSFGIACAGLAATSDLTSRAVIDFGDACQKFLDRAVLKLTIDQRFLYEQLVAAGASHFEALEEAKFFGIKSP